jgi:hypothetical protein
MQCCNLDCLVLLDSGAIRSVVGKNYLERCGILNMSKNFSFSFSIFLYISFRISSFSLISTHYFSELTLESDSTGTTHGNLITLLDGKLWPTKFV